MRGQCKICGGHGYILDVRSEPGFRRKRRVPCPACHGDVPELVRANMPREKDADEDDARKPRS